MATRHPLVLAVRRFVEREVKPVAAALEHDDHYPHDLVARLRELGLFGALIPGEYGGLGLDATTYAAVIEELARGWMSLTGVINSHTMAALIVLHHGTDEQRRRFLHRFARGEARGGLCLTEPQAGSDVQAIRTVARRHGDEYLITGTKMFVTNGREGNAFALLALTDPAAEPRHKGMSCFIAEKGHPGLRVVKSISKLGYKGIDTAELVFDEFPVPARNLVGGVEGLGFKHVMSGLEMGRINIAARAVGVAQAAWEAALGQLGRKRRDGAGPPPEFGDMATRLTAARLLTSWAAARKDRGARADLEAGMAKLYASETAHAVAVGAMRVLGEAATLTSLAVERHYRDTPLMIIGEGTNEIQRLVIARQLLERYGEQPGALVSLDGEPGERRQMGLAVRQFVEKQVAPVVHDSEASGRYPTELIERLGGLGLFGALVPPAHDGLGLDLRTAALILEELGRGWTTLAGVLTPHLALSRVISRAGTAEQRQRLLPRMARGDLLGCLAVADHLTVRRRGADLKLTGRVRAVENALRAGLFGILSPAGLFLVERGGKGLSVGQPLDTLGARGLGTADLRLSGVRAQAVSARGGKMALAIARLGIAATAVGLAQAAFEAALRYSQQRSAFGKPICQHQAIQLKLADMAATITATRLLTHHAAEREDELLSSMAKLYAADTAAMVALEAMRIHGGYGYTTEFPVERYYRDAPRLGLALGGPERDRLDLVRCLTARRANSTP